MNKKLKKGLSIIVLIFGLSLFLSMINVSYHLFILIKIIIQLPESAFTNKFLFLISFIIICSYMVIVFITNISINLIQHGIKHLKKKNDE